MTDNEIINAFNSLLRERCDDCPFKTCYDCEMLVGRYALDLINRQRAEIERLKQPSVVADMEIPKELIERMKRQKVVAIPYDKEEIKTDAIKEFSERLKVKAEHGWIISGVEDYAVSLDNIDNLVKEMVGDA